MSMSQQTPQSIEVLFRTNLVEAERTEFVVIVAIRVSGETVPAWGVCVVNQSVSLSVIWVVVVRAGVERECVW